MVLGSKGPMENVPGSKALPGRFYFPTGFSLSPPPSPASSPSSSPRLPSVGMYKYYNIHIPQFSRLGYKSGETVPVSRNRGRRVWLDILRAKLEAQPSSLRYAQPGGAGRNRENSGLKQFPLLHKNVSRVVFGRMAAFWPLHQNQSLVESIFKPLTSSQNLSKSVTCSELDKIKSAMLRFARKPILVQRK